MDAEERRAYQARYDKANSDFFTVRVLKSDGAVFRDTCRRQGRSVNAVPPLPLRGHRMTSQGLLIFLASPLWG